MLLSFARSSTMSTRRHFRPHGSQCRIANGTRSRISCRLAAQLVNFVPGFVFRHVAAKNSRPNAELRRTSTFSGPTSALVRSGACVFRHSDQRTTRSSCAHVWSRAAFHLKIVKNRYFCNHSVTVHSAFLPFAEHQHSPTTIESRTIPATRCCGEHRFFLLP